MKNSEDLEEISDAALRQRKKSAHEVDDEELIEAIADEQRRRRQLNLLLRQAEKYDKSTK